MCNKNSTELGATSRLCTSMVTNAPSVCLAVAKFWCFRLARGARRQSDQRTASCQVLNSVYTVYTQLSLVCQGHHHALTRPWPATNNITAIYYLYYISIYQVAIKRVTIYHSGTGNQGRAFQVGMGELEIQKPFGCLVSSIWRSFFMTETGSQSCIRWPSKGSPFTIHPHNPSSLNIMCLSEKSWPHTARNGSGQKRHRKS